MEDYLFYFFLGGGFFSIRHLFPVRYFKSKNQKWHQEGELEPQLASLRLPQWDYLK